jgi:hypothetical protein
MSDSSIPTPPEFIAMVFQKANELLSNSNVLNIAFMLLPTLAMFKVLAHYYVTQFWNPNVGKLVKGKHILVTG